MSIACNILLLCLAVSTGASALTETPSKAEEPGGECTQENFVKCWGDFITSVQNQLTGLVHPTAEEVCSVFKEKNQCLVKLEADCKNSLQNISVYAKSVNDLLNNLCKDGAALSKKLIDSLPCWQEHSQEIASSCVKPLETKTPTDKEVCKMIKDAIKCLPGKTKEFCGADAKDVVDAFNDAMGPVVKLRCGDGHRVAAFFSLILAALLVLFLHRQ